MEEVLNIPFIIISLSMSLIYFASKHATWRIF